MKTCPHADLDDLRQDRVLIVKRIASLRAEPRDALNDEYLGALKQNLVLIESRIKELGASLRLPRAA